MTSSTLGGVIDFLNRLGLYDVVLPFLLVFTLVFAVLEKTKILGHDPNNDKVPKSNLNAMVAFVMALMFVAATKLVQAINLALPYVVLMLIMFISILLLVATFYKDGEFDFFANYAGMKTPVLIVVIIGVVTAFLYAMGWLNPIIDWITNSWDSTAVAGIFFGLIVLGLIFFIVQSPKPEGSSSTKSTEKKT